MITYFLWRKANRHLGAFLLLSLFAGSSLSLLAQTTTPTTGLRDNTPTYHALTNARIVTAPGEVIPKGVILLKDGIIQAVGEKIKVPADARVWDYSGKTIYPGLIESYSHLGIAKPDPKAEKGPEHTLAHWNPHVLAARNVLENFQPKEKDISALRARGYTSALVVPRQGIFRGSSALVSLGKTIGKTQIIHPAAAQHISFSKGISQSGYPNSLMGSIALIRQILLDAQWYQSAQAAYQQNPSQPAPAADEALIALQDVINNKMPVIFEVSTENNLLRALTIAREFNLSINVKGSGREYFHLAALPHPQLKSLILPTDFPDKLTLNTPESSLDVSLLQLQHWEQAPANPARIAAAGVPFALTKPDFAKELPRATEAGLSEKDALAALTITPAKMLGVDKILGSITVGKRAHLLITDKGLFEKGREILDVWVDGERFQIKDQTALDVSGKWQANLNFPKSSHSLALSFSGKAAKAKGKMSRDSLDIPVKNLSTTLNQIRFSTSGDSLGYPGTIGLSATVIDGKMTGIGDLPDGQTFTWTAEWQSAPEATEKKETAKDKADSETSTSYKGIGAYFQQGMPVQPPSVLVKNATIWTSGPQGTLENADIHIVKGKIAAVGESISGGKNDLVIDAAGKHITPGLIDAHSHAAVDGSVNEGGQAVSAEVRIRDVIDPFDIAMYRQLAGGLTVINILHGSANPIGGQNAVLKLRWGADAEGLLLKGAPEGIKFALGENVKQSNWGDNFTTRYPQTRMGVQQIIRDRFKAAREYQDRWTKFRSQKKKRGVIPPRRDLELEALLEILNGERFIHCHSYRQDEILMLVRVAEEFSFQIATFQHVLEGYKVADELATHNFGASTFSDWWAYKFEVYDAIPHNGALMHQAGVNVSFNSDSNELSRRMNTEAAKAVKYGGVSPADALKFVTINPAQQLGIDQHTGSLEVGKDADFAIWNGNPLSTFSSCEQTWIEGRKYFDIADDREMQAAVIAERARIIEKYRKTATSDGKGKMPVKRDKKHHSHHWDDDE